jgi:predicted SAM-dependent methyltransferase
MARTSALQYVAPPVKRSTFNQAIKDLKLARLRLQTYLKTGGKQNTVPSERRLHLGCGSRRVPGWLNVDLAGSDYDLDLSAGFLPWVDEGFESALSQHVIEHLDLRYELIPLLEEVHRTLEPGGDVWLSTPDMDKVCASQVEDKMQSLVEDRKSRVPSFDLGRVPSSHFANVLFHQWGEHKNLFDFDLLRWTLEYVGFTQVERTHEAALLERFPGFPPRHDDRQSLYVRAVRP